MRLFFRREGRPGETAYPHRPPDRPPLRPTFKEGFRDEVQVVHDLVVDMENPYDISRDERGRVPSASPRSLPRQTARSPPCVSV
jgi:hypothetical protein